MSCRRAQAGAALLAPGGRARMTPVTTSGRVRQDEVYRAGVLGRRPVVPTSFPALEARARRAMSRRAFAYIAGGAGTGETMRANRAAFDRQADRAADAARRWEARHVGGAVRRTSPRRSCSRRSARWTSCTAAPTSPSARAAAARGRPDDLLEPGRLARWRRSLRPWANAPVVSSSTGRPPATSSTASCARAEAAGGRPSSSRSTPRCSDGGPVTSTSGNSRSPGGKASRSTPPTRCSRGWTRETAAGPRRATPRPTPSAVRTLLEDQPPPPRSASWTTCARPAAARRRRDVPAACTPDPRVSWADIATLRTRTRLPVVLKGVLHPDDARRALRCRGGRRPGQQPRRTPGRRRRTPASTPCPASSRRSAGPRTGPARLRGAQRAPTSARALALGARAVCLGRPFAYGLALAGGGRGVARWSADVLAELDLTLGLAGARTVADLDLDVVDEGAARPAPVERPPEHRSAPRNAVCRRVRARARVGAVDATRTVLLIRHGDTHGYFDDVGLTERGEAQAREKGKELAALLPARGEGGHAARPHRARVRPPR